MFTGLRLALHLNSAKSFDEPTIMVHSKKELEALPVGAWIQETSSVNTAHLYAGGLIKVDSGLFEKRNGNCKIASRVKLPAKILFSEC